MPDYLPNIVVIYTLAPVPKPAIKRPKLNVKRLPEKAVTMSPREHNKFAKIMALRRPRVSPSLPKHKLPITDPKK